MSYVAVHVCCACVYACIVYVCIVYVCMHVHVVHVYVRVRVWAWVVPGTVQVCGYVCG
jgi:hypothetical protein